jgi:hypothetical protein
MAWEDPMHWLRKNSGHGASGEPKPGAGKSLRVEPGILLGEVQGVLQREGRIAFGIPAATLPPRFGRRLKKGHIRVSFCQKNALPQSAAKLGETRVVHFPPLVLPTTRLGNAWETLRQSQWLLEIPRCTANTLV